MPLVFFFNIRWKQLPVNTQAGNVKNKVSTDGFLLRGVQFILVHFTNIQRISPYFLIQMVVISLEKCTPHVL
jgi:hypothetical protein